ncbi:MAG: 30S ribosomal protein S21 [bacterium]|nr:30S ribosomal protein S21 [bacterium]
MVKVVKREGETAGAMLFRFSKKVKQSGVLKESKKRRFRARPVNRRKKRLSAKHREEKKAEIKKARKMGLV